MIIVVIIVMVVMIIIIVIPAIAVVGITIAVIDTVINRTVLSTRRTTTRQKQDCG